MSHLIRSLCFLSALFLIERVSIGRGEPPERTVRESTAEWPGLKPSGSVLLPNGWSLKPAGRQVSMGDFPAVLTVDPAGAYVAVLHAGYGEHSIAIHDAETGAAISRVVLPRSFAGLAWTGDGKRIFAGGGFDDVVYRFDCDQGSLYHKQILKYPDDRRRVPGGIAVTKDGKSIWVANVFGFSIAKFDAESATMIAEIPLDADSYPYGISLDETKNCVYVSLWGKAQVAVVDTESRKIVRRFDTQEHPNEILTARGGSILYVANANRNTVSVIDVAQGKTLELIGTSIDPKALPGSTPSSLALTRDEKILFVSNANTNDVAVVNVEKPGSSVPLGFIPTGWYPTSIRISQNGKHLYILNGKGTTSKANRNGPNPTVARRTTEYIGGLFQGTMSILPVPGPKEMIAYTKTVHECLPRSSKPEAAEGKPKTAVPAAPGEPSPIKHVVYIIKENRTYDQVFGDMPEGNGEQSLCLFPEKITPNHHAIAREFVLLDNFYVDSEVSADGHEWTMGAYATDFVERIWPLGYRGDPHVPYPSEGSFKIAEPAEGYLWDRARVKGITYRSYGEFVKNGPTADFAGTTKIEALQGHFDPFYRSFDMDYPDRKRAERFLHELAEFEKSGDLPRLIVLRLPNDHTAGTKSGSPTVMAAIADNDLALGLVVEGLSKSRFWKDMAIFVVEDDAQNGADHVDAHRTVALAISPYIKKHSVDSTLYSTASMLRTMELFLGLEPMSRFDASATPMSAAFGIEPDDASFVHKPATIDPDAKNTATAWGADLSNKLDLTREDQIDDLLFNEIIWKAVRGPNSIPPAPVRAAFVLPRERLKIAQARDDDD